MKREPVLDTDDVLTKTESVCVNGEPYFQIKEGWLGDTGFWITLVKNKFMFKDITIKDEIEDPDYESANEESSDSSGEDFTPPSAKYTKIKKEKKDKSGQSKSKPKDVQLKSYICTVGVCSKRFYVKRRFEGHLRQHQGLKPAPCTYCTKEFSKWIALDQHIDAEHSNRTPDIKCDFPNCEKTFTTLEYKKRHIKAVHRPRQKRRKEVACTCHECGKSFLSLQSLKVSCPRS
jgi:uncharacterized Zn-finger protein